jgi:hypothetical protein
VVNSEHCYSQGTIHSDITLGAPSCWKYICNNIHRECFIRGWSSFCEIWYKHDASDIVIRCTIKAAAQQWHHMTEKWIQKLLYAVPCDLLWLHNGLSDSTDSVIGNMSVVSEQHVVLAYHIQNPHGSKTITNRAHYYYNNLSFLLHDLRNHILKSKH